MNKILKNIPCKIYYAGIFLVVMMFLVLFFINHFIQYDAYSGGYPFSISGDIRSVPS